jgi:outer membrane protein TolC
VPESLAVRASAGIESVVYVIGVSLALTGAAMAARLQNTLAVCAVVLLVLNSRAALGASPNRWEPGEVIVTPPPQVNSYRPGEPGQIVSPPTFSENAEPPPIQPAQPTDSDQVLPVNLATALCLSHARPLVIAFAQASVEEAAARLQNANVLWLPNLNVGWSYYRHDGTDQATDGTIIIDDKYSQAVGAGATLAFGLTDAIFRPLADRQELAAREAGLQQARNDALLTVASAYFDVQQARGTLAGTVDAVSRAEVLARKTAGLAKGLVAEIEVDRARALLFDLQQQVATARANWRIASARLTRVLRLTPGAVVVPIEPPHLQITMIPIGLRVNDLIPVGLNSRPELVLQRALVQASLQRVRQERMRPLLPTVIMQGVGPEGYFNGGLFGGGPDDGPHRYSGRFDLGVGAIWTLNNLGAGNHSLVRERMAEEDAARISFANRQDQVAEDVVQAHAQLQAAATQVQDAMIAVKEAAVTYDGTLKGLAQTRGFGELLQLVNRPQEAVAALQQLNRAYGLYFAAINGYNRAQFQLYWAMGYPAHAVICDLPDGQLKSLDIARPADMATLAVNIQPAIHPARQNADAALVGYKPLQIRVELDAPGTSAIPVRNAK